LGIPASTRKHYKDTLLEETLTLHRLGIAGLLRSRLSSTNRVESALSALEAKGHRVAFVGFGAIGSSPCCGRRYAGSWGLNKPSLRLRSSRGEKRRSRVLLKFHDRRDILA
jgi:hypothetical protein